MKNFLFDLYGTLADIRTDEYSDGFWQKIGDLLGSEDTNAVKRCYFDLCAGVNLPVCVEIDLSCVMREMLSTFGSNYSVEEFCEKFREASIIKLQLFDGAEKLLNGLAFRGCKIYLLSNAQACFTLRELDKLGIKNKFNGIILSSEIGFKKPSEKFFHAAFNKFSLKREECVYIGNDLNDDVLGARNVGMRSIYIQTEQSGKYGREIPVDMAVSDYNELINLAFELAESF